MLHHRRREFASGNHFSFSHPIHKPQDDLNCLDGMEYGTWAERIKGKYSYFGKSDDLKFGAWTRRIPRNDDNGDEEFKWLGKVEDDDDSDVPSPPLWKKAGTPIIHSAETSPVRSQGYYHDRDSHISHSSRAQIIARYRQEMLDLVRDMPENAYELSLKDIVEAPRITKPLKETLEDKLEEEKEEKKKRTTTKKATRKISRSESMDTGGFLLKMFIPRIPTSLGGRKRSSENSGTCAKVSPKPMLGDGEKGGVEKSTDGEWWSKEFKEMISSSSSSSSSDSSSGRSSRKLSGCYSFFRTRKSKSMGI